MLQSIREKVTGPLAWVVVGIISVPFAFFGVEAFRSGGGQDYAVKVNGEKISRFAIDNRVDARFNQLRQMLGDNFRPDLINRDQIRQAVTEELINQELIDQYLSATRHSISDAAVAEFVASQEAFMDADGAFSPQLYRDALSRQGSNPSLYEAQVRDYLSANQFETAVRASSFVSPQELAAEFAFNEQTRTIRWRRYALEHYAQKVTVEEEQVQELFEQRQSNLRAPERVRVDYLVLDPAEIAANISVSDAQITAYYADNSQRFATPETREARHILVDSEAEANELRQKILAGEEFSQLAAEFSQDPGSAASGGDLGVVSRGVMVAPFEEAVFSQNLGDLSAPVETQFGWHLIEVTSISGGVVAPLEEVRDEVVAQLRAQAARESLLDLQDEFDQLVFENPTSLEPAAQALNLELQTSAWFTRQGGAGITGNPSIVEAAFSPAVLEDGDNSGLLQVGERVVALRLNAREEERPLRLEEVRDDLTAELRDKSAREMLREAVNADLASVQEQSSNWGELANHDGVTIQDARSVQRDEPGVDRAMLRAAFEVDAADQATTSVLSNGRDMALIQVQDIRDADIAQADEATVEALRRQLNNSRAATEMQLVIQNMRAEADIVRARATDSQGN
nr:SurA N-terminal domain-containing protein [Oceanococcus sp. HetDA_MAG_MS8]